jgi:hypothetical protein
MDLTLRIIKTKANLWSIYQRIKFGREKIEKDKPTALDYINGAKQSEEELLEAYDSFTDLSDHIITLSRENSELARRNILLLEQLRILKDELKYKDCAL